MPAMRTGITTGACAAAAAKAAAMVLRGDQPPPEVTLQLDGREVKIAVESAATVAAGRATAAVRKDAGDDPDVTHGMMVVVTLWPAPAGSGHVFLAGAGVGTVTKPGLQVPPGQPAINPGPRRMIAEALAEVTPEAMHVEISIPGGQVVAAKTYNPRLGIVGGLSVLGTTGMVRPYCRQAMLDSLRCELDVAKACGVRALVLAPGNIGSRVARRLLRLTDEQLVEVGNEWGYVAGLLPKYGFEHVLAVGHPGKLAKLAEGEWDTHSSRSASALPGVAALAGEVLSVRACESPTVEGLFGALAEGDRRRLADELARRVAAALGERISPAASAVLLVNMAGEELGRFGDLRSWQ